MTAAPGLFGPEQPAGCSSRIRPRAASGLGRALCLILALALAGCRAGERPVVIGSKNFTEQILLGELLALQIESKTGLKVDRRLNLGGTFVCHQGITSGQIDLYVEYTGTAFTAILKHAPSSDPQAVYREVKREYADRFDIEWMEPLGFNNTFAIVVRGEDARRLSLETISDAAPYSRRWRAGFGYEFMERADGYPGLEATYGLHFLEAPRVMDLGLIYRALSERQVDLVAGNATDGLISSLDLAVLQDDRHYFPPYEAAPLVRKQTLARHPELGKALRDLAGLISEEEMRRMNYRVDAERRDARNVAAEFLKSAGR